MSYSKPVQIGDDTLTAYGETMEECLERAKQLQDLDRSVRLLKLLAPKGGRITTFYSDIGPHKNFGVQHNYAKINFGRTESGVLFPKGIDQYYNFRIHFGQKVKDKKSGVNTIELSRPGREGDEYKYASIEPERDKLNDLYKQFKALTGSQNKYHDLKPIMMDLGQLNLASLWLFEPRLKSLLTELSIYL